MNPLELQAAKAAVKYTLQWEASNIMIGFQSLQSEKTVKLDLASIIKKPPRKGKGIASDPVMLMHKCDIIQLSDFEGLVEDDTAAASTNKPKAASMKKKTTYGLLSNCLLEC